MTKWDLFWEYKYGLTLGKSISIIAYINCSKEKLSVDDTPDTKSMYCMIPFMKKSKKCKPTSSDRATSHEVIQMASENMLTITYQENAKSNQLPLHT